MQICRVNNFEFDENVSSKSTKNEKECKVPRFYFSGDIFGDKYQAIRMWEPSLVSYQQ